MQLFRLRDKKKYELLMLFEKEMSSNIEVIHFYKKIVESIGGSII
jgi:hypothetical protein